MLSMTLILQRVGQNVTTEAGVSGKEKNAASCLAAFIWTALY